MTFYKVGSIHYDTDGEEVDLPKKLLIEVPDDSDPEEFLCDEISNLTGYCHLGFNFTKEH